jgi:hypothetical protein
MSVDTSAPQSAGHAPRRAGWVPVSPAVTLRVEGAVLLAAAVAAYGLIGVSWWWFAGLLLVPDLGMLGYLAGPRIGAFTYNLTHTLSLPLAVGAVGLVSGSTLLIAAALIWLAHIGMDRALGYGLKYPTHFRDTHLQRVA